MPHCTLEELFKSPWGPLAYVTEAERDNILNSPCGEFKHKIAQLEKEIVAAKKKNKSRI